MTTALIIFGMLIAFYSGFYFGYMKREGKPPSLPIVNELVMLAEKVKQEKEAKPDKEEEKANSFFN